MGRPDFEALPPEEQEPKQDALLQEKLGKLAIEAEPELNEILQRRRNLLRRVVHTFPGTAHGEDLQTYSEQEARWLLYSALWVDETPYYVIGERSGRTKTELLLHKPKITMMPESFSSDRASLVIGTVPSSTYASARKKSKAALEQGLILADEGPLYDEKYGIYTITSERPSALSYHEDVPVHLTHADEGAFKRLIDKRHIMTDMRSPDIDLDFSLYGVAEHIEELAAAFGQTENISDMLQKYVAARSSNEA